MTSGETVPTILVVDDEAGVRDLMARWLRALELDVVAVGSAEDALATIRSRPITVALCDIRMPGRDGLWLAEQVRRLSPDTAVVMATGVQDVGSAVTSLRHGVIDYLMKPFGRDRLREAVQRGIDWHRAAVDARAGGEDRLTEAQQRREELATAIAGLHIESRAALEALVTMLALQDRGMIEHSRRVAQAAIALGRALGVDAAGLDLLDRAALAHEIEKLTMPPGVIQKEGPLSPAEQELVRQAPEHGYRLLEGVPYLAEAAAVLRARHERWDGGGYPRALAGEAIPLASRILAVADTYESMVRPRRPQPALPVADALQELDRCSGTQFDPDVVAAFRSVVPSLPPARPVL
ncbi:MAG: response regulator [Vicinamibacteraceae bacterium]|nr:response regulator [Vicinamibacteraceae bacterium]